MTSRATRVIVPLAVAAMGLSTSPAHALLIAANYEGLFDADVNYRNVANAAKDAWELLAEPWYRVAGHEVTITFSTADLGGAGTLALTYDNQQTLTPNAVTGTYLWTAARVVFNSNAAWWNQFWWDPTPLDNSEYDMTQAGGLFGNAKAGTAADDKFDAYSTVLHEIGHVLGFMGAGGTDGAYAWSAYTSFADNLSADYKTFTYDYLESLKGTTVPMGGNPYHVDWATYPFDSMRAKFDGSSWISGPGLDERILISQLDLDMISDAFHLVPEPGTLALTGGALLGLLLVGRRRRAR